MTLQVNSTAVNDVYLNRNVGYTVVGRPTITNGVVSGFSASDYCELNNSLSNSFNFVTKITTASYTNLYRFILGAKETREFTLAQGINKRLRIQLGNTGTGYISELVGSTELQPETSYYIWIEYNNSTITLYLSTDGLTWNNEGSISYTLSSITIRFGVSWTTENSYWRGSIDLNKTYIKINGVTWFNGKDVNFSKQNNYIINNSNLVWANPNLWLQGDKNSYIDTGITATNYVTFDITAKKGTLSKGWIFGGAGSAYNVDNISLRWYEVGSRLQALISGNYGSSNGSSTVFGNKYWVKSYIENGIYYVNFNDVNIPSINTTDFTSNTISLFSFHRNGGYVGFSDEIIYNMKLYNNGTLVRNLVPVPKGLVIGNYTVPSNGMWDIVSQTFFANQGTGSFTFGKDGNTPVRQR